MRGRGRRWGRRVQYSACFSFLSTSDVVISNGNDVAVQLVAIVQILLFKITGVC